MLRDLQPTDESEHADLSPKEDFTVFPTTRLQTGAILRSLEGSDRYQLPTCRRLS